MKKKFALRLFTALLFPVIIASCGKEEEQETVQPAADLVIDNSAVTLLQGDEITAKYHFRKRRLLCKNFRRIGGYGDNRRR